MKRCFASESILIQYDVELAARMITGITYSDSETLSHQVRNELIKLLNGPAIDVDKLDYILRDTWASGVSNFVFDVDRLTRSMMLAPDDLGRIKLHYSKSALSVLQSVIDAKNYLFEWVYCHHAVEYYSEVMRRSVKAMAARYGNQDDPDCFYRTVFSPEVFEKRLSLAEGDSICCPTDGDIVYLLKKSHAETPLPHLDEVLCHSPRLLPVWKTWVEYRQIFAKTLLVDKLPASIDTIVESAITRRLDCSSEDVMVIKARRNLYEANEGDIRIRMNEGSVSLKDIQGESRFVKSGRFFYLFVSSALLKRRNQILRILASLG